MLDSPVFPDPNQVSYRHLVLRYGGIVGAASVVISLIAYLTDTDPAMPSTSGALKALYTLLSLGVSIWAITTAVRYHRNRELGGYISVGRAVMIGLGIGLVAGLIGAVYMMLYTTVINPDFGETMQAAMQEQWEAQGMSEDQIEMAGKWSGWATNPIFLGISQIIGGVFGGVVMGVIIGAIMKRDRPLGV